MKGLVIIPAYNESKNLEKVILDIQNNAADFDYVIINDCSTDNTKTICHDKGYNIVNLPVNLGIGGGVQTGYKYALEHGYDVAVQFDGDGQHDAKYIHILLDALISNHADMIIGSRFINKEGFQSSFTRRLGIKYFSQLIKLLTGKRILDVTSGFRMVNRNGIRFFCEYYPKDYPEPETIVSILKHGGKVAEIPVKMREREAGSSSIDFIKSIYYMVKVSIAILIAGLKKEDKSEWHYNLES